MTIPLPGRAASYPELRYMGSKKRLLPWIHEVLDRLDFETALDPFSGTGCVAYLMKATGHSVTTSDFLNFPATVARATIENSTERLEARHVKRLLARKRPAPGFIAETFAGVFFTPEDLGFLDRISAGIRAMANPHRQALAYAALFRACLKRQPRGVFTVSGDLSRYDDGRRDLKLSVEAHFLEQVEIFNGAVFCNGRQNRAAWSDVFALDDARHDLVYLDPPYVPRSDDNCYVKRYHFLEGLSVYWQGMPIDPSSKVRKIAKKYTPFSYRKSAEAAFDRLFARFADSIIVLSYSSNGFPDLARLEALMRRYKRKVEVFARPHRYHFGTHAGVARAAATEYLIVGS